MMNGSLVLFASCEHRKHTVMFSLNTLYEGLET